MTPVMSTDPVVTTHPADGGPDPEDEPPAGPGDGPDGQADPA